MNEADTRAERIDPQLRDSGWGVVPGSRIQREVHITAGRIQTGGVRAQPVIADYVLSYRGRKLAVVEAKSDEKEVGEGVAQAKEYAAKMQLTYTYAANGREIYQINMHTGKEGLITAFPTPDELWELSFAAHNDWQTRFDTVPFEDMGGTKEPRYYQEIAVNRVVEAIANGKKRVLLTLATGTGKTFIAFQIAWKLFQTRWNLLGDGKRRPRILFLADRNILADQAYNAFASFAEDAKVRIKPDEIRKKGYVPTNGNIFFTIFQTFMSGDDGEPYFGDYPKDFFDLIVIDECHRGGANDESTWRDIMEYFSPAVQLGLTATPKRDQNVDTYKYFGDPVYIYSLKEGIGDGFLTPFRVKRIQTTLDEYFYTSDDEVLDGEVDTGRIYIEKDFNKIIEIKEREAKRVQIYMQDANQREKALVFCATQAHAAMIRDMINQMKDSHEPNYCVRVTANDGALGEEYLRMFQDNEKLIPTILTTSQKLSTGVDARNVRNIVLLRPVNSMIEFKQIIGRGTRLFEGKEYFTIYDYVDAYHHFADPEWDGEPVEPEEPGDGGKEKRKTKELPPEYPQDPPEEPVRREKLKIKLADGKERAIQHMVATSFWGPDGQPMTAMEFLEALYGVLPTLFSSEAELREVWSNPKTRKALLNQLSDAGYDTEVLEKLRQVIDAENSDLFDVLEYVAYAIEPITRENRVNHAQTMIFMGLDVRQRQFIEFVLQKYIEDGVTELAEEKLSDLLKLKYYALEDGVRELGGPEKIRGLFFDFQKHLYSTAG